MSGYTLEDMEAAMCMWEYVQYRMGRDDDYVWGPRQEHKGIADLRATIMAMAPQLEKGYQAARALEYDDCFDMEFVPTFMEVIELNSPEQGLTITDERAIQIGESIARAYK